MGGLFGVPWFLWWGLAAAVPILIHLFARQRFRRVPWAAMDFLLRAFKKTRRRIRLEHLLLLLLRILAILLFVAALAEPLVNTAGLLGRSDRRREVVVVLDDSFSMGLQEADGTTAFQHARDQAVRLVRGLRSDRGDSVTLVTAGRPADLRLKGSDDLDRAAAEIDKHEVSDGATDLLGAFQTVVAALEDLRPAAEVYLFSDLQKVGFIPPAEDARGAAPASGPEARPQQLLASLVQQMRLKQATLFVVAPREANTDNLAVVALERTDKAVIAGVPTRVSATIHNFGAKPQRGVVHLYVDGGTQPADLRELEVIPPGGAEVVDFRHTFAMPGSHNLEVRFSTDSLVADNRRALAVEVRDRIRALVVDGDPRTEAGESESFFLASVLDPGADGGRPAFAVDVVEETRFDLADLAKADLLVLMNVGLISPKRAEDVQRFVHEGGGLLVYLGDRTQPATMNGLLWKNGAGVLPAEILEPVGGGPTSDVSFNLVNPDFDHPALAYFDDPQIRPWLSLPPVYRFYRTRVAAGAQEVRVLASFDQARAALPRPEPAILEKLSGKGKTVLVTTSGDQEWTDIPAFPTNVLLVRELAYHLTRREARLENVVVGQTYQRTLRSVVNEVVLSRDGEQLQVLKPLPLEGESNYEVKTSPLAKAGVYRLDLSGQPEGQRREPTPIFVAANVDPVESDLARVGEEFILSSFDGGVVRYVTDPAAAIKVETAASESRAWWWTLLLALVALLADTALSQIFGLRSRGGGSE